MTIRAGVPSVGLVGTPAHPTCTFLVVGRTGERCGATADWQHDWPGYPTVYRCREHRPPERRLHESPGWRQVAP